MNLKQLKKDDKFQTSSELFFSLGLDQKMTHEARPKAQVMLISNDET
jgi:hypothetical protein